MNLGQFGQPCPDGGKPTAYVGFSILGIPYSVREGETKDGFWEFSAVFFENGRHDRNLVFRSELELLFVLLNLVNQLLDGSQSSADPMYTFCFQASFVEFCNALDNDGRGLSVGIVYSLIVIVVQGNSKHQGFARSDVKVFVKHGRCTHEASKLCWSTKAGDYIMKLKRDNVSQ